MGRPPKRARARNSDDEERPPGSPRPRPPSPPRPQLSNEEKARIKVIAAELAKKFVKNPPKLVKTPEEKKRNVNQGAPASFSAGVGHYNQAAQPSSLHTVKTKQQLQTPIIHQLETGLQTTAEEAASLDDLLDDATKDGPTITIYRKRLQSSLVRVAEIISDLSKLESQCSILLLLPTLAVGDIFSKFLIKTEGYRKNKISVNTKSEEVSITVLTFDEAKRANFPERYDLVVVWNFQQCDLVELMESASLSKKFALIE